MRKRVTEREGTSVRERKRKEKERERERERESERVKEIPRKIINKVKNNKNIFHDI